MTASTILALHGFGGAGRSWDGVRNALTASPGAPTPRLVAPDLRGHGASADVRPVDLSGVLTDLIPRLERAAADGPVTLAGYSLGGRIALHLALARPEAVARLVLVSASAGISDPAQRRRRREQDEERARRLEAEGLAAFAAFWATLPLWDGDPPAVRAAQRDALLAGDPDGLAAALRGLGPGTVPAVGDRLATLALPLRVVVGGRDRRYRTIGARLLGLAAQPAGEVVVADAGHGLLREAPAAVAAALRAGDG